MTADREVLGRLVRATWDDWARAQPDVDPRGPELGGDHRGR